MNGVFSGEKSEYGDRSTSRDGEAHPAIEKSWQPTEHPQEIDEVPSRMRITSRQFCGAEGTKKGHHTPKKPCNQKHPSTAHGCSGIARQ